MTSERTPFYPERTDHTVAERFENHFANAVEQTMATPNFSYLTYTTVDDVPSEQVTLSYKDRQIYLSRPVDEQVAASGYPYRMHETVLYFGDDGAPRTFTELYRVDHRGNLHTVMQLNDETVSRQLSVDAKNERTRCLTWGRLVRPPVNSSVDKSQ